MPLSLKNQLLRGGLNITKGWVATVFWIACMHLARPDVGAHAHVCVPLFYGGRTSYPHVLLKLNFKCHFKKTVDDLEAVKNIFL